MKKIEHLPHTADICIKIEADTLEALFETGIKGMNDILKEAYCLGKTGGTISKIIEIRAVDRTALLIDFMSDVLTSSYCEKAVFCEVQLLDLKENYVRAEIKGREIDFFDEDIKAVTYHEAEVQKNTRGNWETRIIFDI